MATFETNRVCGDKIDVGNPFYYASIRSLSLGAPFWYVFSISVALSLSICMRNNTPEGSDRRVVGRNTK